jgi:transketolase
MDTKQFSTRIRKIILERSYAAHVGHIGSGLSIADIIALLYATILHINTPNDPDRERFVLSKGHAALALYAALHLRGWITEEELNSFGTDFTLLGVHPEHKVTGIDFCTGSLGQGLTYGVGCALAARLQKSQRRTFVLISDAECNEGSVWEAAMFAAQNKLSNLIVLLDLNGQQALGYTSDILDLSPMSTYWRTFGWDVLEVDGHDIPAMERAISNLNTSSGSPHILIANTIFGKGISFMENQIKWHYLPLSESDYQQACDEIENMK